MAFEKNPLQDGVKTKLKDYSVDLENRIGDIGKADIGLGSVLNYRQVFLDKKGSTKGTWSADLADNSTYLLMSDWTGNENSASYFILITIRGGVVYIREIGTTHRATFTSNGRRLNVNHNDFWGMYSLIRIS